MVDLMRLFAGEFAEVKSFVSNQFWKHDVEDNAYAMLRTNGGVVAMLHSSATQWRHRFELEITLHKGTIILSGILSGSKSYGSETMTVAYASEDGNGDPKEVRTLYNDDNSWWDEIVEFAACINEGTPVTNGSSMDALRTMQLVYRIYCADASWGRERNLSDRVPDDLEDQQGV
jgi:predicted dehydrogenase